VVSDVDRTGWFAAIQMRGLRGVLSFANFNKGARTFNKDIRARFQNAQPRSRERIESIVGEPNAADARIHDRLLPSHVRHDWRATHRLADLLFTTMPRRPGRGCHGVNVKDFNGRGRQFTAAFNSSRRPITWTPANVNELGLSTRRRTAGNGGSILKSITHRRRRKGQPNWNWPELCSCQLPRFKLLSRNDLRQRNRLQTVSKQRCGSAFALIFLRM
jgi:hypothetical protein